ncbi:MAG: hypothetical protein QNL12_12915 [Acidimicrobiia bacterium]|nr:hypothetical protein [Acidimicrobiia bacterium]MDX2468212.1 hypothetical protein [Acidimicrobiia bacterium]
MTRHEYRLTKPQFLPSGRLIPDDHRVRAATAEDHHELADLMMDAYLGTIDYEGETPEQAVEEVGGYLETEAYLEVSRVAVYDGVIQSAVMMSRIAGVPLVGFVMTRAAAKGQGLGSALLDVATAAVWATGAEEMRAFITEGNLPSEAIFVKAGYEVIATYGD